MNKPVDHKQRQNADWDVDVEGVPPGVGVCEPATERRSKHRGDNYSEGEDGHRSAALCRREGFEQDRLRDWLQRSSSGALSNTRQEYERKAGRGPAGEAGDR